MSEENVNKIAFDDLPKELLLEVCNYLSIGEIKNLSLTSKALNELVSTNVSTLKKLHLKLDLETSLQDGKKDLTRSYSQVNINFVEFKRVIGLWLTSSFCRNLKVLKMMHVEFQMEDKKLLRKTLQSLHNLETLQMSECDISDFENSMLDDIEPVEIKSLKSIHLSSSHLVFLLFLKTPNLQALKICNKSDLESPTIITSFLAGQPLEKLEKLALWTIDFEDFEEIDKEQLAKIQIPLRSLSTIFLTTPFQSSENFSCFLNLFSETITELDFRKLTPEPPPCIYEIIFKKFHKMKTLRFSPNCAPDDHDFYNKLSNNPAVTTLIVYEERSIQHEKALFGFISKLPNIETLIIKANISKQEVLQFIATHCVNLKNLVVNKIIAPESSLQGVRMPSVKALTVCSMKYMETDSWKNIVRSFRNLQSLSIHRSDQTSLNDRTFNIFTKGLTKIKHFMFGEGFVAVKRVFNQMKKNCPNLKTVEMLKSSFKGDDELYKRVLRDFQKPGLNFICYTNMKSVCEQFDQFYGSSFWKTSDMFDVDEDDYEDYDYSESDDDSDFPFDSEDSASEGELADMLRMIAHGPGGVPWYDSDSGEQQMGRFDSDGEWEPWDAEYYLD